MYDFSYDISWRYCHNLRRRGEEDMYIAYKDTWSEVGDTKRTYGAHLMLSLV